MKVIVVSVSLTIFFFTWDVFSSPTPTQKDDAYKFETDSSPNDPLNFIAEEFSILEAIKCRGGYYNMSDDFVDAIYYCAQIEHVKNTRRKFTDEKVRLGYSPTPLLCMHSCICAQAGLINSNLKGINETAVLNIYTSEMTGPGGKLSAFKLTKELMECDKKHPTKFPARYHNCSVTEDFFRCARRVMFTCSNSDDKNRFEKEYLEYLARNKKSINSDDD